MNRTAATCIAGVRSRIPSTIEIHFQRRIRLRDAEPFPREFRFFAFGVAISATVAASLCRGVLFQDDKSATAGAICVAASGPDGVRYFFDFAGFLALLFPLPKRARAAR